MKTQETLVAEIESDIHMTVKRRNYAYAGEHAGWLDRAAKRLLKVKDDALRIELFMKIVRRALKLLRVVDDSNASLQSVLWEGSYCFQVWKQICQCSGTSCIKGILKKLLPEDTESLADGLFFPQSPLPIPDSVLWELIDFVLIDLKFDTDSRRKAIVSGCLGWLAQLKDEEGFDELVKSSSLPDFLVWPQRFNLYLNLGRYDDALQLAHENTNTNPRYCNELTLQVFERNGDRNLLLKTALKIARNHPTKEEFKRLKPLLNEEERNQFVSALMDSTLSQKGFDVPFCEVLFAADELKALHSYAVARYKDIYDVRFCTGMVPLAKKLFKAGEPLPACIFMRGAIYFLMGKGNSKYYSDVHTHMLVLEDMSAAVTDWESVEPQREFYSGFAVDFANRRTFWS